MKVEELKLYNKYKNINNPDIELIYIGINVYNRYCFLFKNENYKLSFLPLINHGLNPDKIVKDLNLEIGFFKNGHNYFKGYDIIWFSKKDIENYFKPHLKDKINNILNR